MIMRSILVMGLTLSLSQTALAVDPDMQALVIDNGCGSGYRDTSTGQCLNVTSVPEPSSLLLLVAGSAALGFARYRRRKS